MSTTIPSRTGVTRSVKILGSLALAWALAFPGATAASLVDGDPGVSAREDAKSASPGDTVRVVIRTDAGSMVAELYPGRAPATVANFLRYVDAGHYDGGVFHRTVRVDTEPEPREGVHIDVIQADIHPWEGSYRDSPGQPFGPIPLERTHETDLQHRDGTLSMARTEPDTATSSFFICIGDQPELDYGGHRHPDGQGFAAFGRVVEGMEVVRWIHQAPARGQAIVPPVRILEVERMD